MPDASLGEKLKNWRLLSEGLKLRIEEVPFLKEDHTELSAWPAHAAADGAEAAAFRSGGRGAGELALAPLVGLGELGLARGRVLRSAPARTRGVSLCATLPAYSRCQRRARSGRVGSLGPCFCLSLPEESREEEATIASMLLAFVRSPDGADGMAMLASRGPHVPRQVYRFPGSQPLVQEVIDALLRKYGGCPCEPPAAEEAMFLVGSTAVWKQLRRTDGADGTDGHKPRH